MTYQVDFKCPCPVLECVKAKKTDIIYWVDSNIVNGSECHGHYKLTMSASSRAATSPTARFSATHRSGLYATALCWRRIRLPLSSASRMTRRKSLRATSAVSPSNATTTSRKATFSRHSLWKNTEINHHQREVIDTCQDTESTASART